MQAVQRPQIVTVLICIYCVLNASDLVSTWVYSSRGLTGAFALALWASPVAVFWYRQWKAPRPWEDRPFLLGLALLCTFQGILGSLHVLGHIGLALALASLIPPCPVHPVWLASSLSWMPALDWFGGRFFPDYVSVVRILTAALPAWVLIRSMQNVSRSVP